MAIADDIAVAANGAITWTGLAHGIENATYYTVIEFHRFLQDLADDAVASGNDLLDITDLTPSARSTDNIIGLLSPYNIDVTVSEHLFDGTISQNGGDDVWDGIVNYGTEGIHIEIIQAGAVIINDFWNTIPYEYSIAGSYAVDSKGLNRNLTAGISHRFMVKVIDSGTVTDNRRLIGTNREFNKTFGEFNISATANGNNTLALTHSDDLNNAKSEATVGAFTGITNTEGYSSIDVNNDGADEYFYSEWVKGANTINDFYERMKWLTMRDDGGGSTIYGLAAEVFRGITHEVALTDLTTGAWVTSTAVTWTGGTGQILAIDSLTSGSATEMWIQLLTGVTPTGTITNSVNGATATVGAIVERTVSTPFVGASTGSALIGSYGFGVAYTDLKNTDKVFDLTNTQKVPPNNVKFTVTGVTHGEDRILVGPDDGAGDLDVAQFGIKAASALTTDNITAVAIDATIPTDTPANGTIRVYDNNGIARRLEYSSYTGDTFTISSTDGNEDFGTVNADAANNVFVSYVDALYDDASSETYEFTGVYLSDRDLFIRVRDGGGTPIKTFEGTGTMKSTDQSISVIRTADV